MTTLTEADVEAAREAERIEAERRRRGRLARIWRRIAGWFGSRGG